MRQSLLFLIGPMLALACGQAGPAHELPFGSLEQPIIDGTPSDASEDGVVYIKTTLGPNEATGCTGTLIAPSVVLTAGHCASVRRDAPAAETDETHDRGREPVDERGDSLVSLSKFVVPDFGCLRGRAFHEIGHPDVMIDQ